MSKDKGKGKPGKGDQHDDVLEGTPRSDLLLGKKGGDILIGKGGDDLLIGGKGSDTAVYSGSFLDYKVLSLGPIAIVQDLRGRSPDGTDLLLQIEKVQFADYTLHLDGTNNAPYALADAAQTSEDDRIVLSKAQLLANDRDPDGHALSIVGVTLVSGEGSVALVKGNVAYDPGAAYQHLDAGETATVVLEYKVTDGRGAFDTAHVTITVTGADDGPANHVPVAGDDAYSVDEDGVLTGAVLANDTDADLDGLQAVLASGPAHGTLVLNADGTFTYRPGADFNGTDSFTYRANDGEASSNLATVTIDVAPVNDAPVTQGQSFVQNEDGTVTGSLANSTSDVDDTEFTYQVVGASKPKFKLGADGSFSIDLQALGYDSLDDGETETLSFDYLANDGEADSNISTVTITVTGVNDAPGTEQLHFSADEDTPMAGAVAVLDPDDAPGELVYSLVGAAPAGLTLNADGSFSFDPRGHYDHLDTDQNGEVSFQFVASDGDAVGGVSTATIHIAGVNDAPVTANQSFVESEDGTVSGSLANSTSDPDDSVSYQVVGASKPKFKLGADGSFSIDLQALGYDRLDDGEIETFSFDYLANDGEADSNVSTVTITVQGLNDAPVAEADFNSASDDGVAATGNLLGNDTDLDENDELSVGAGPHSLAYGTLELGPQGHYSYLVTDERLGLGDQETDTFTYSVSDGTVSSLGTITFTVIGANDGPVAGDDFLVDSFTSNGPVTRSASDLLGNDTDVDRGTVLALQEGTIVTDLGATVTFTATGYTYDASGVAALDTLPAHFTATDRFSYTVSDGDGGLDSASVDLSVYGRFVQDNAPPVANPEAFSTNAMYAADGSIVPMSIPLSLLLRNDFDPDGDPLSITRIEHSSGGSFAIVGDTIQFTPTPSTGLGPLATTVAESEPNDDFPIADFIPRVQFGLGGDGLAHASYTGEASGPDLVQFELRAGETLTIHLQETSNFAFLGVTDHDNQIVGFSAGEDLVYTATRDGTHGAFVDGAGSYEIGLSFNPVARATAANLVYVVSDGQGGEAFGSVTLLPVFGTQLNPSTAGSDSDNNFLGGPLADVLQGGNGNDTLTGGGGSDRFEFFITDGFDTVTDFQRGPGGDVLDLNGFPTTYAPGADIDAFVRFDDFGVNSSRMLVDADGSAGGAFYQPVALLEGQSGLSASQLLADGNLLI